jgi:hypothetical protein
MNTDKKGGLGPEHILTIVIVIFFTIVIICTVRSYKDDTAEDDGACRMALPAAYYETSEANASAAFHGNVRPRLLDPEYAQTVASSINEIAPLLGDNQYPELDDDALLERLRRAISGILVMEPPPCAWRWDEVKDTIGGFGNGIPIARPWPHDARFQYVLMAYSGTPRMLIVNPGLVSDVSDGKLESFLIHEATHDVFERLAMATSGFDHSQLLAAQVLCGAFDAQMVHIHEGLATWNELRSYAVIPIDEKMREDIGEESIRAIGEFDLGRPKAFTQIMAHNLGIRAALFGTGKGRLRDCNYPPIFEGDNKGRAFIPNGIDDPLVTAFGLATRLFL